VGDRCSSSRAAQLASTALADANRGRLDRELDQAVESAKAWCRVVLACRRGGRRWAAIEVRLLRGAALEWDSEPLVVEDAISRSLS
jgi:hypothetical protein